MLILGSLIKNFIAQGDGVIDSALACCAGGPSLIPAVGEAKQEAIQMFFLWA